jgi:hypothetical protein
LASASVFVIIPGSSSPETASVDVPVLLAVGDRDICGAAHSLPASFARSPDVTVVELAETGHSHFAFASVDRLFPGIADWVADVTARLAHGAAA